MKKCLPTLLVVGLLTAAADKKPADDKAKLQGTWSAVAMELVGRTTLEGNLNDTSFTFDRDRVTAKHENGSNTRTFKIDATQEPPHFDLISDDGKDVLKLLYRLDGDTLKLYGDKGDKGDVRPKSYEAAAVIITLRREKQ